jgi:hypothetical protein
MQRYRIILDDGVYPAGTALPAKEPLSVDHARVNFLFAIIEKADQTVIYI